VQAIRSKQNTDALSTVFGIFTSLLWSAGGILPAAADPSVCRQQFPLLNFSS
jgi:hypothetical protein